MFLNCGVGEDSWESLGDPCKEIQPVHPKGNQSWIFIARTDAEVEAAILWPPDAKSWLIWKDPDAGKDWRREEKGMTEDEMAGWHHQLKGHEFEWTTGVGDGQGGLACCRMWGHKESDMTERLNWTELNWTQALTTWCLLLSSETWPNKYLTWITLIKWSLHNTVRSSLQNMHIFSAAAAKSLSRVWLCATLWIAAHQAPLSTGFSRQEYWSGFPIPSPYLVLLWAKKTL